MQSKTSRICAMILVAMGTWFAVGCQKENATYPVASVSTKSLSEDGTKMGRSLEDDDSLAPYNLNVFLRGSWESKGESEESPRGFIKFRQNPDPAQIVTLQTWVAHLIPDHAYQLQRAVNPIAVLGCPSITWLTLGAGTVPLSIHTDAWGRGEATFWRDLSAVARGTEFNIHFQIVDSVTKVVVLSSDCYQYTVR